MCYCGNFIMRLLGYGSFLFICIYVMFGKLVLIYFRCCWSNFGGICVLMWNISFSCLLLVLMVFGVNWVILVIKLMVVGICRFGVVLRISWVLLLSFSVFVCLVGRKKVI